jgi:threonine aldolase
MEIIDLRSDTVTQPTPEMREAMAEAEVGDDVYGEDPTINYLQEITAEMMGKEASLFVSSGTMGNLIAILVHCNRGHEMIVGDRTHIFLLEAGGYSALGGVHPFPLPNQPDGTIDLDEIRASICADDDPHHSCTRLITIENTHNACGGRVLGVGYMRSVCDIAHENNLLLHLDGARIFNAAIAQGVDVKELTAHVDSVMFCLSKGLCAPVGSMLCGSKDFVSQAVRIRKQLGGGMRQAGILAAAGIVALERMVGRLAEDHVRAHYLAKGVSEIPGLSCDVTSCETNMVYFHIEEDLRLLARDLGQRLSSKGLKVDVVGTREIRFVTHYWIDDIHVDKAISILNEVMSNIEQ